MSKNNKGIRTFNKYVTNRLLRGAARAARGPFALLRHVGRKSGKPYEIPIMVWPMNEGFVIELTYGKKVDWLRNVTAAGGGTIVYHKKAYAVGKPEPMDAHIAAQALPAFIRGFLHVMGKHEYVFLKIVTPAASA